MNHLNEKGFTAFELLTSIGIFSIMLGLAIFDQREADDLKKFAGREVLTFMREARAQAISSTLAYTVVPLSNKKFVTYFSNNCFSDETVADPSLTLDLPQDIYLTDTDWSICYNSRGLADSSVEITLASSANSNSTEVIQAVLGGGIRLKPNNKKG